MNKDFTLAMRRATEVVRGRNLTQATAIIQQALAGGGDVGGMAAGQADGVTKGPSLPRRGTRPGMPLGKVLHLLREGRPAALPPGVPARLPDLPAGARFLARNVECPAGARFYRLYVPSCPAGTIRGLVVMLHGCNQTPEDFAAGTGMNALAERHRLLVAYPGQVRAANVSGCWNWFDPAHQARDAGEPAILAALTREVAAEFALAPDRVFVAGLSAGGAMAAVMAETYPDLYAAAGIHSGLPHGAAHDVASAFAAMRGQGRTPGRRAGGRPPRLILFHGSADSTVSPSNAGAILAMAHAALPDGTLHKRRAPVAGGRPAERSTITLPDGTTALELWMIEGAGHAWSGGDPAGSYTDPRGPDASAEMVRFFLKDA